MIEEYEWINMREMHRRAPINYEAQIDPDASHVVGQPVRVNDQRLIQLVLRWKRKMNLDPNGTQSYNFYQQSGFIEELKQAFHAEA